MVADRMPARITPASMASSTPLLPSRDAMLTMSDSAEELESNILIEPLLAIAKPMIPMRTATAREMTTHAVPTRRLTLILFSSSAAMKWIRTWGIPK